jgi:hypothetical protein
MDEESYIIDQGVSISDLVLIKKDKNYHHEKYPLKAAVCPDCGHVELYIDVIKKCSQ